LVKNYLLNAKRIGMIELAVTEVTVNIIKHAYQSRSGKTIQINAEASADEIEIRFYDRGEHFDQELVPQPVFDGLSEGGFGLYIIAHTVDEVLYSRDEQGRNCTCLKIKLTGEN
ncbi:MAG: ATP-binding protein, partial [Spirochaetales bacterium]|nr:ATP-binding protein [Spirochaetales bacterium]